MADEIGEEQYYLFGAHQDDYLSGPPGKIIAKRHGAICHATGDGAIWIERLKRAEPASLKLPASSSSQPNSVTCRSSPSSHTNTGGAAPLVIFARKNRKKLATCTSSSTTAL